MATGASVADALSLQRKAMLIRSVEQRLLQLFGEGKLFGTVHTCIGEEWTGVAVAEQLQPGDYVFSNHRCHGHYLARTQDVDGLIAEIMGKTTGICGGRGGSQHICSQNFFSNGVQGGIVPVSAGIAWAKKLEGSGDVAVAFIGDGTLGEGALYEAMNVASKWELPLIIVLENNLYAQSTSQTQTLAGDICARAEAFGIRTWSADTWNQDRLLESVSEAFEYVRGDSRPAFVRIDTYRLMAHSKGDDDRDPAEVKSYWEIDPIQRFTQEFPDEAGRLQAEIDLVIDGAVRLGDAAEFTTRSPEDECAGGFASVHWRRSILSEPDRIVHRIHLGLRRAMERDNRVVMIGEDIEGPYGGAFKVTKNLSLDFPGRVRNMPISEAAIAGMGNGLALVGMRPVCEIMFGDFLALAADQWINHASKFRYMYNDQVTLPLIVRTPMGGKRGYGATHSQSIEKHFLGLPGTQVLAIHHRHDPAAIYDTLFETIDCPTLVIENKLLYGIRTSSEMPDGFVLEETDERFPTVRLRPEATPDVTLVCYGGMLHDAEKAAVRLFDEQEIVVEIVAPTRLFPFNVAPVLESVERSRRLVVVEEGHGFVSFGSEVLAQVQERGAGLLLSARRLAAPDHPIPSCKPLEVELLPGDVHIEQVVREMMHG
jgi:2-oxoisovalerate dehydrogenase E1 component